MIVTPPPQGAVLPAEPTLALTDQGVTEAASPVIIINRICKGKALTDRVLNGVTRVLEMQCDSDSSPYHISNKASLVLLADCSRESQCNIWVE